MRLVVLVCSLAIAGCASLLGIEDVTVDDAVTADGGDPPVDASSGPDGRVAVDAGAAVDQSNLLSGGALSVGGVLIYFQSATAGQTGTLVGIELSVALCQATAVDSITIAVNQSSVTTGVASLTGADIPGGSMCGALFLSPLSSSQIGPGYFDLTSQNVTVTSGEIFEIQVAASPADAFLVSIDSNADYLGGKLQDKDRTEIPRDLTFKTFVE